MLRYFVSPFLQVSKKFITTIPKSQLTTRYFIPKIQYKYQVLQSTRGFYGSIINKQIEHLPPSSSIKKEEQEEEPKAEVLNPKHQLLIGFTCKVCQVRSHHVMSKQAYTKGVVLIQCPECKNRHLIADNLGWFRDEKTNVEDLVKEKGEAIRKIIVDDQGQKLPVEHLMEWIPEEEIKIKEADENAQQLREKSPTSSSSSSLKSDEN